MMRLIIIMSGAKVSRCLLHCDTEYRKKVSILNRKSVLNNRRIFFARCFVALQRWKRRRRALAWNMKSMSLLFLAQQIGKQ